MKTGVNAYNQNVTMIGAVHNLGLPKISDAASADGFCEVSASLGGRNIG